MTNELAIRILTGDVLGTSEQTHDAIKMAVKALSADAVAVVRCEECIHKYVCTLYGGSQFYCAYGERGEANEEM